MPNPAPTRRLTAVAALLTQAGDALLGAHLWTEALLPDEAILHCDYSDPFRLQSVSGTWWIRAASHDDRFNLSVACRRRRKQGDHDFIAVPRLNLDTADLRPGWRWK